MGISPIITPRCGSLIGSTLSGRLARSRRLGESGTDSGEGEMQLTGKVVLVTGAQQGIGAAMAREFPAAGADVAINWLDDEGAAQRVANEVRGNGRRVILVKADVGQLEQVKAMVSEAQEGLGPIDVLINNAAVFPRVPFLEMTEHDWG